METGYDDVDDQHRALYSLVNDLNACAVLGNDRAHATAALERIVGHTVTHFQDEEALMLHSAYPRIQEHIASHRAFSRNVAEMIAAHRENRGPSVRELAEFMDQWIENHIRSEDQLLVRHVRA
jgi:hemerythrin